MFKNKTLVIVAIVILALLGGAAYLSLSKSSTNQGGPTKTATPTTSANSANNTTLAGLLALGQNLRCTFNVNATSGGSTQGTFYVSNGNLRGDFVMKGTDGKENQMSMIRSGDENFIWGAALPTGTGIKMKLSLDKLAGSAQASQFANVNQKTNYNCIPWSVDASLFTPPTNVKFTDIGQMMAPQATAGTTKAQTSPCDQITDPTAKASCLKALSGQ